jgi:hypothetical protein
LINVADPSQFYKLDYVELIHSLPFFVQFYMVNFVDHIHSHMKTKAVRDLRSPNTTNNGERYASQKRSLLFRSVNGTEVALVSQETVTEESFLREKEARRLFGTKAILCH